MSHRLLDLMDVGSLESPTSPSRWRPSSRASARRDRSPSPLTIWAFNAARSAGSAKSTVLKSFYVADLTARRQATREVEILRSALTISPSSAAMALSHSHLESGPRIETGMGLENQILGFGSVADGGGTGWSGRGRKRLLIDLEDRVPLQRQKRMIKNRESAARSLERKHVFFGLILQSWRLW